MNEISSSWILFMLTKRWSDIELLPNKLEVIKFSTFPPNYEVIGKPIYISSYNDTHIIVQK